MLNRTFHNPVFENPAFNVMGGGSTFAGEVSTGCVKFDGSNDYIAVPDNNTLDLSTFSISCWVKPTSANNNTDNVLVAKGAYNYLLYFSTANKPRVYVSGLSPALADATTALPIGIWSHIIATFDGTTLSIAVNGRIESSVAVTGTPTVSSIGLGIGAHASGDYYFRGGCIDDVRIYNVALTAAQIQAMYENTTPAPTSGLVGHWKLDDGSGITATDSSGNGNNGTLTYGPTWEVQVPPRLSASRITEDWSVDFDGTNDVISVSDIASLNTSQYLSMSGWFKFDNRLSADGYVTRWESGKSCFIFRKNFCWIASSTGDTGANYTSIPVDTFDQGIWNHVTVVFDGTLTGNANRLKVFKNGVQLSNNSYSGTIPSQLTSVSVTSILLGSGSSTFLDGKAKDVRIYNSALSQSDITKLANGQESTAVPVARWRLNEGTGTTANDSIGSNHGTLTNEPTWSGDVPQWHRAIITSSHAGVFDGTDDTITIGSAGSILSSPTQWSILAWVNEVPSVSYNYRNLVQLDFGGSWHNNGIGGDFSVGYYCIYTEGARKGPDAILPANTWTHLGAVVVVGSSWSLYKNGVAQTGGNQGGTPNNSTGNIIGGTQYDKFFGGNIDDVCIYNRALEAACVADAHAGYLVTAGLVARYKLDSNANDSVGSNHGTENGGMTYTTAVPGSL